MNYTFLGENKSIVYLNNLDLFIHDCSSALDLMMTIQYETGCCKLILNKESVVEEFFRLSSGLAGDILQKFINYHMKLAVVGDFSKYTSKPLHDFIYESNRGNDFFFVTNLEQAIDKLNSAK